MLGSATVISGISGGSLLAALYAYGPEEFAEFDDTVSSLLRGGLQARLTRRALSPAHFARRFGSGFNSTGRSYNRTDAMADLLADIAFGEKKMDDGTHDGLATVLTATDLRTGRAVRFGSAQTSCSVRGRVIEAVPVCDAVAASAAFPILLPAMQRTYTFERADDRRTEQVALTDGGVFDNLGLSVLEPGRDPRFTDHVYPLDYVIACDAGRQDKGDSRARVLPLRLYRSFDITYRKTQDGSRRRLHIAGELGEIRGFVHTYLGMKDDKLPVPAPALIPLERVNRYPTNFAAMSASDFHAVTRRGEQLTRHLLSHYCPELIT